MQISRISRRFWREFVVHGHTESHSFGESARAPPRATWHPLNPLIPMACSHFDSSGEIVGGSLWTRLIAWRICLVPLLLCAVAMLHFWRHYTLNQSSWGAGCGFGMFATVDHHGSRFIRCHVVTDAGIFAADISGVFEYQNLKARVVPTRAELHKLASWLTAVNWQMSESFQPDLADSALVPVIAPRPGNRSLPEGHQAAVVKAVQLELRGVYLDLDSRVIESRVLQQWWQPVSSFRATLIIPADRPNDLARVSSGPAGEAMACE